jgi:hypothetical protein
VDLYVDLHDKVMSTCIAFPHFATPGKQEVTAFSAPSASSAEMQGTFALRFGQVLKMPCADQKQNPVCGSRDATRY